MCGIVGIIRRSSNVQKEELKEMNDTQIHRGPDGEGYYLNGKIGFGHRRLSIIDLESGVQPMSSIDEQLWITYNGELYNYISLRKELESLGHEFRTQSDTEVIIYAFKEWGKDCLNRLRGMFAFAIHDKKNQKVFLARDQFGIKPLLYRITKNTFSFSSELKAQTKVIGPSLKGSLKALDAYLALQYIPAPLTIYKDVYKLEPGTYMEVSEEGDILHKERYYDLNFKKGKEKGKSSETWLKETDNAITDSIRSQLISDVPFGVFLSGGIDSTLVALKMSKILGQPLKAFTIAFNEKEYSELGYAEKAAKKIGVELISEVVQDSGIDILPDLINDHFGEPFGDSSAIPTWYVSRLARKEVTMVLTGDGGDEMFGGYHSYNSWMKGSVKYVLDQKIQKQEYLGIPRYLVGTYKEYLKKNKSLNDIEEWINLMAYTVVDIRKRLWRSDVFSKITNDFSCFTKANQKARKYDRLSFAQYVDINTYLPYDILTKVDVSSMANSLETRPPLIDIEIAKIVETLPLSEKRKLHEGVIQGKAILKELLLSDFDKSFVYRKKQGFAIPKDSWFLEGAKNGGLFYSYTLGGNSRLKEFFNEEEIKKLWRGYNSNEGQKFKYFSTLWLLFVFSLWLEKNSNIDFE